MTGTEKEDSLLDGEYVGKEIMIFSNTRQKKKEFRLWKGFTRERE